VAHYSKKNNAKSCIPQFTFRPDFNVEWIKVLKQGNPDLFDFGKWLPRQNAEATSTMWKQAVVNSSLVGRYSILS